MPAQKLRPRFCKADAFTSWDRSSGARPTSSRVCSLLHVGSAPAMIGVQSSIGGQCSSRVSSCATNHT